ncbi:MAG: hypothetical protein GF331_04055 [Chitinivibrionales bacterium]|nr:hypothetical protein [Chitinivibrionales bacterium]
MAQCHSAAAVRSGYACGESPRRGKSMSRIGVFSIVLFVWVTAVRAQRIDLPIDPTVEHQTIDGFGALVSEWNMGIHNDQALINRLVRDLGVSIMRYLAIWSFEQSNENSNESVLDLSQMNVGGDFGLQMEIMRKFENAAEGDLYVDKHFVSPLSPPAWMKTNGDVVGGKLRTDMYAEYAEYLAAYCKAVKQETGIDLHAMSLENEPEWEQWYASCVIEPAEMRDLIKVVGPRFESEGVNVRLLWSETLLTQLWGPYLGYTMQDPVASQYVDIYALHAYDDGINPGDPGVQRWKQVQSAMTNFPQLTLWMSETSGYDNNWQGGLTMAQALFAALKYGHVSAWVWHSPNAAIENHIQEGLMYNGEPKIHYWIAKQFYRWIRPGAVMIEIDDSGDDAVGAVAFRHRADNTLTVVLINSASTSKSVSLSGPGLPEFQGFRTSTTQNCVSLAQVGATLTLPASSVTTLYGEGYSPAVSVAHPDAANRAATKRNPARSVGRIYSVDGRVRRLSGSDHTAVAAGVVLDASTGRLRALQPMTNGTTNDR